MTSALATPAPSFGCNDTLLAQIRAQDAALARELLELFTRPLPSGQPFDWAVAELVLDTPIIKGQPFNATGREYLRDPINDINADDCREQTCCWGTGNAKTLKNLVQATWAMEHAPFSGLFILPSKEGPGGGRQFNNGSLIPTIERTRCFADKIPTGADRHNFSGLHLQFAGNNVDLAGANSPTQLGAKRCQFVWLDEQDKYKAKLGREEGADYLAGERTKQVPNAKIIRGSTPTKEDFGIWPHLMRSDLRRRFLPCPLCNSDQMSAARRFVLIKDAQFSVMPTKFADGTEIPAAPLVWDKEAKRQDGTWDMDRVIRSARFECPHCQGHIQDHHRIWLDKNGVWLPTRLSIGHKGYHLPSFYAPHIDTETSWGHMAKKFLDKKDSGELQGYINSDLAEVHVSQEQGRGTITFTSRPVAQADWTPLLTVDVQKQWPYLWFVVRKWSSFKLLPPVEFSNGRPVLGELIPEFKAKLERLVAGQAAAWLPVAELLRFDTGTAETPLLDFLLAKDITGTNLAAAFRERCMSQTVDFGKWIYREMGLKMPRGGDSESVAVGHCQTDDWAELREIFTQFEVGKHLVNRNAAVLIDSGYRERNNPEVLRKCYETATEFGHYDPASKKIWAHPVNGFCKPVPLNNWQPWKGYPIRKRWNVDGIAREWHYNMADPFGGSSEADQCVIQVLEGAADLFWERFNNLRENRTSNVWAISGALALFPKDKFQISQYERQLNARYWDEEKQEVRNRGTGGSGHRLWPDELNDCEKMQVALADSLGFFSYENQPTQNTNTEIRYENEN